MTIPNDGVFLLTNNGTGWNAVNIGLTGSWVSSIAINGTNIFAGTGSNGGLFLSTNNGASWNATGLINANVISLTISGANIFAVNSGGAVYLSTNNGTSWNAMNNGMINTPFYSLAISGTNIFAGTGSSGVYLSTNNGASWNSVCNGLPITQINSLAVNGTYIFAGTWGEGIWKRALSEMIYPNCSAKFTLTPDTTTLHHYYIINNASGIAPLTYYWSWGDGTHDTIAYPSHLYNSAGFYNICLTITDSTGCTSTYCDTSYLQKTTNSIISVQVIPGASGINENELSNQIKFYPNPVTDYFQIQTSLPIKNIEIIDITGRTIYTTTNKTINCSSFAKGVYFVKVQTEKGMSISKFIKQ